MNCQCAYQKGERWAAKPIRLVSPHQAFREHTPTGFAGTTVPPGRQEIVAERDRADGERTTRWHFPRSACSHAGSRIDQRVFTQSVAHIRLAPQIFGRIGLRDAQMASRSIRSCPSHARIPTGSFQTNRTYSIAARLVDVLIEDGNDIRRRRRRELVAFVARHGGVEKPAPRSDRWVVSRRG